MRFLLRLAGFSEAGFQVDYRALALLPSGGCWMLVGGTFGLRLRDYLLIREMGIAATFRWSLLIAPWPLVPLMV